MTVGIVGLGLIGGSFAKAYHAAGATVLAYNRSRSVLDFAMMSGAVDGELTQDNVSACDLVLIALYPEATVDWFRRMAAHIGSHPVVIDCGGTKRTICAACFPIAQAHDEMIAFTSQMAHVVSNAYIKSPTAAQHKGFSAGSYKDMTRVAWLSPEMWAELFLENKDNLLHELDIFMAHLGEYRDAMQRDDLPALTRLLDEGRRRKEEVDGR